MRTPFQIFGPFNVDGTKVADKEYLKKFWSECDEEYEQLSEANGLYVFSLSNGSNYEPNYVGITKKAFTKEVFNPSNVVKILKYFIPQKGKLNLHLLAKPKDTNVGFYCASKRSLLWTEMFLLLMCRKKNPDILNIVGHAFLEDCAIDGITNPSKGRGKTINTFRSALGFDNFGMAGGNGKKRTIRSTAPQVPQRTAPPAPPSTIQPIQTAQPTQPNK